MSLALAEVLMKQSGDASLDRARAEHKHHGLNFHVTQSKEYCLPLDVSAAALAAAPLLKSDGRRFVTFELWHRSCREMPLGGHVNEIHTPGVSTSTFKALLFPLDNNLAGIPASGISLLDCFSALPGLMDYIGSRGLQPQMVRAKLTVEANYINPGWSSTMKIAIHPGFSQTLSKFFNNVMVNANDVDRVNLRENISGGIIFIDSDPINLNARFNLPNGSMYNENEIRLWTDPRPVHEFGYFYLALFILGNYARYYPDKWLREVEQDSPLALASEELIRNVESRVPLLALSEMTRLYHVPAQ